MVLRHANRNHVFLNVLAVVDARIEASGNDIYAAVVGGYIEDDIWITAREVRKLWPQYRSSSQPRHQKSHAPSGFVAQTGELVERILNISESRTQPCKELFSRLGRRDAARGP